MVQWGSTDAVIVNPDGTEEPFDPPRPGEDRTQFAARSMRAVRVCPNPDNRHFVPYTYGDYGEPVVVGLIGDTSVGKTLLLTAMVGRLQNAQWLDTVGLQVKPLDVAIHQRFEKTHLDPFLKDFRALDATPFHTDNVEFTYATTFHRRDGGAAVAVAFFDVSGERLHEPGPHNRFLSAVNALIFVVDAGAIPPPHLRGRESAGDRTFELVLDQLDREYSYLSDQFADSFLPIPAAIVVGKADRLDFDPDQPTRRWFAYHEDDLELETIPAESADVYAFLATRGGGAWLKPAHRCCNVSLHFASATNCQAVNDVFPKERFRQRRVLKPLLSLLAMKGVIDPRLPSGQGA